MTDAAAADDGDGRTAPTTERVHETSWSVSLEGPEHAADRDRVVRQAIEAVEHTAPGVHVNLVTHGAHGRPTGYLADELEAAFGDEIDYEYVERCGCGGHVFRVHV
jgi:putative CGCGG family rSAM target protein